MARSNISTKSKKEAGQSLAELLVALGVGTILVIGVLGAVSLILRNSYDVRATETANLLAEQYSDAVKSLAQYNWHAIYDLNKSSSSPYWIGNLPTARFAHSCVTSALNNKIYCFGGFDASFLNQIVEYDPLRAKVLVKQASLPTPRAYLSCAAYPVSGPLNGRIYCFGGYNGTNSLTQITEYDPSALDAPGPIATKSAILLNPTLGLSCVFSATTNKIYCFGGVGNSGLEYTQILEYDPSLDSITLKSNFPTGRAYLSCAAKTGSGNLPIFCFGGVSSGSILNQIVEYDPWIPLLATQQATLPISGGNHSCATDVTTGKIYCFVEWTAAGPTFNQIAIYDSSIPDAPGFIPTASSTLPSARINLSCANDPTVSKIYCLGGNNALVPWPAPIPLDDILQYAASSDLIITPQNILSGRNSIVKDNTTYTINFYIDNVNRILCGVGDVTSTPITTCASGPPSSGVADDPSTRKLTTVVTWGANYSITKVQYLTRYKNNSFIQTDWLGGSGQEGPVVSINNKFATSSDVDFSTAGFITIFGPPPSANLISSIFDTGAVNGAAPNSLMWLGNLPPSAVVSFQIASSNCVNGATDPPTCSTGAWSYKGPNGSGIPSDVYAPSGPGVLVPVNLAYHNNQRYFRYKIFLQAGLGSKPRIDDVIINWSP